MCVEWKKNPEPPTTGHIRLAAGHNPPTLKGFVKTNFHTQHFLTTNEDLGKDLLCKPEIIQFLWKRIE